MKKIFLFVLATGITIFIVGINSVLAYTVEDLTEVPVKNDFVLGAAKVELWMNPGEEATKELMITNRLGKTMNFRIDIEDFTGSKNPEETVVLLGGDKGPYSLRDYLKPEITEFTLNHGQRMILAVKVSIPQDVEPGGLYGSILVSSYPILSPTEIEKEKTKGQIQLISRLASLFFIRVKGEVKESGYLQEFKTDKRYYEKGLVSFEVLFKNNGSIHLTPYGVIEISNIFNKKVEQIELNPWFSMPDSLRLREVKWERKFLFGRYKAALSVNRGYEDIIDQKSIEFWIIPWKIILAGLVGLFLIFWFFRWIASHFEIRRKK